MRRFIIPAALPALFLVMGCYPNGGAGNAKGGGESEEGEEGDTGETEDDAAVLVEPPTVVAGAVYGAWPDAQILGVERVGAGYRVDVSAYDGWCLELLVDTTGTVADLRESDACR